MVGGDDDLPKEPVELEELDLGTAAARAAGAGREEGDRRRPLAAHP